MPDKDVFDRNLAKGWRNAARCIHNGIDPKIDARRVALALRKDLQVLGDFPGWKELYHLLTISTNNTPETTQKVFEQVKSFERASDDRDLAGVLAKACLQTHIEMTDGRYHNNGRSKIGFALPCKKDFVKRICEKFLDYRLHSKVDMIERSNQKGGHWNDPSYRQAYFMELELDLEIIAETLVRDPSFTKPPSFPRHHRVRQTTEELMDAPLELIEG